LATNPEDEERGLARLLNPFDGPGTRRPKKLIDGALRSLGDGPPAHQIILLFILNHKNQMIFRGPKRKCHPLSATKLFISYLIY
jgi:hypothetical protein